MGDRKHRVSQSSPAPTQAGSGTAPRAGAPPQGNAAVQEQRATQGQRLAPEAKTAIGQANAARWGTGMAVKMADRAGAAATGTDPLLADSAASRALGTFGRLFGGSLSAAGHFVNDSVVASRTWGHAIDSGTKGALDTAISAAVGSPYAALPGAVDAFVPQDSAYKPLTSTFAAGNPVTQFQQLAGAGVDGFAALSAGLNDGLAGGIRAGEAIEANAVAGRYGSLAQGLTAATAQSSGDTRVIDAFTGPDAESGKLGPFVRTGNTMADEVWAFVESIKETMGTPTLADKGIQQAALAIDGGKTSAQQQHSALMDATLKDRWAR